MFDAQVDEFGQGDVISEFYQPDDAQVPVANCFKEVFLVHEVVVESSFGESDGIADIADGDGLVAFLEEELVGLFDDIIFGVWHSILNVQDAKILQKSSYDYSRTTIF
jgi:hypothetical protein